MPQFYLSVDSEGGSKEGGKSKHIEFDAAHVCSILC
jgi:hypothetical protein